MTAQGRDSAPRGARATHARPVRSLGDFLRWFLCTVAPRPCPDTAWWLVSLQPSNPRPAHGSADLDPFKFRWLIPISALQVRLGNPAGNTEWLVRGWGAGDSGSRGGGLQVCSWAQDEAPHRLWESLNAVSFSLPSQRCFFNNFLQLGSAASNLILSKAAKHSETLLEQSRVSPGQAVGGGDVLGPCLISTRSVWGPPRGPSTSYFLQEWAKCQRGNEE